MAPEVINLAPEPINLAAEAINLAPEPNNLAAELNNLAASIFSLPSTQKKESVPYVNGTLSFPASLRILTQWEAILLGHLHALAF
ncbi:hypothetical protein P4361_00015 [Fictibacillus sp. B-59209]|uniref:hypothetical protein n=1 Tax=Fictibacillus sp. B-59209 TaxID=3024873 RepID=UPI002E22F24E|nr:hypothetical protein [Fictibacillus sp. B-59209]